MNFPKKSSTLIQPPLSELHADQGNVLYTLKEIDARNESVEDDPRWIADSYKGLKIRSLRNVREGDYEHYRKYLDDGAAYIIVHPSFFPFFHTKNILGGGDQDQRNVVENFLDVDTKKLRFAVLQAQERRMRDFLEYKSTERKLVILVLPFNHQEFKGYTYKGDHDEYTRYINEVTNESESVLYVYSRSANRGYLRERDLYRLMELLAKVEPEKVLLGGGYVGRCQEGFYVDLVEEFGSDGVFIVPELSDISPRELKPRLASRLLAKDGTLDVAVATEYLKRDVYNIQSYRPDVLNLNVP